MYKGQKVGAVIVAAGESKRMGGVDKMSAQLAGKPVLARVIDVFQECSAIDQIVVVMNQGSLETGRKLLRGIGAGKPLKTCAGGKRRQDSVAAGLSHLDKCDWVVIHDGARPLVTVDLIERGLAAAQETGAAIAAVPVTDTVKIVGDDDIIKETPSRDGLWAAQTPQVFRYDIITQAYRQVKGEVTDDASLLESAGGGAYRVKIYPGAYDNIKITTPEDLVLAECLLKKYGS